LSQEKNGERNGESDKIAFPKKCISEPQARLGFTLSVDGGFNLGHLSYDVLGLHSILAKVR